MRILLFGHMEWPPHPWNVSNRRHLQARTFHLHHEPEGFHAAGRQRVVRKNVAYEQALRAAASLTKLIAALKLDTKKAAPDEAGDGEDEDDDLDDY